MSKTALSQKGIIDPKIIIGGIVVLVVIFFLATGSFKGSITRTDQATTPFGDQTETPESLPQTKSYQNDQYGFGVEYPSNWSIKERQGGFVAIFQSPQESAGDRYLEFLGVKIVNTSSQPNLTLQDAADLWEKQTVAESSEDNFQVVNRQSTTVAGLEAQNIAYTVDIDNIPAKGFVMVTKANNNIYIFQYFAETDKYEKFLPDIEGIISSVTL